jgi:hypothetical protein
VPQPVDRYNWQQQVCGEHGPGSPTARLVLLAISLHMNAQGANAWPSQATIARRSCVSTRVVVKHLGIAERQGWLKRYEAGRNGQGWRLTGYEAVLPDHVYELLPERPWESDPKWQRREPRSPPLPERGEQRAPNVVNGARERGEGERQNLMNHVPTNLPSENLPSRTKPKREGALARTTRVERVFEKAMEKPKAETQEDCEGNRKLDVLLDLLSRGTTWSDCVLYTRSMGTTLNDVEKADAYLRAMRDQFDSPTETSFAGGLAK